MKRILIVFVIVALLLCGCGKKETEKTQQRFAEETQQRFVVEYRQSVSVIADFSIIRDTETGKAYLFARSGYAGGLTILEEGE